MKAKYRRVLLKISGEAFAGNGSGIDDVTIKNIARQVIDVSNLGVEIAIVVGGGNFWRGRTSKGMDRATADYIGMMATVMNAMALQDALEQLGKQTRMQTAIEMRSIAEPYVRRKAIRHLEKGRIVIFGAGTGSPFFSTDTAAALRATEISAEIILLAKNIDAVYSDDPEINPNAERYDHLTHRDVLDKELKVMDSTAAALCRDNNIKIHVFAVAEEGNVMKAVCGENIGTLVE